MEMKQKKKLNNGGFSLVELIIVIAILVVLVGILAPIYIRYVEKSRITSDQTKIDEVVDALRVLASDPDNELSSLTEITVTWRDDDNAIITATQTDTSATWGTDASKELNKVGAVLELVTEATSTYIRDTGFNSTDAIAAATGNNMEITFSFDSNEDEWKVVESDTLRRFHDTGSTETTTTQTP